MTSRSEKKFYNFKEAIIKYKEIDRPEIALDELVLLILGLLEDKPVNGKVVMQKEVFIFANELKENNIKIIEPTFVSLHYGPFSQELAVLLELLELAGYIRIWHRRRMKATKYELTDKGKNIARKIIKELENKYGKEFIEKLRTLRIGLDQLGHDGILRYVYRKYPRFAEKSKIKDKYPYIDWGVSVA